MDSMNSSMRETSSIANSSFLLKSEPKLSCGQAKVFHQRFGNLFDKTSSMSCSSSLTMSESKLRSSSPANLFRQSFASTFDGTSPRSNSSLIMSEPKLSTCSQAKIFRRRFGDTFDGSRLVSPHSPSPIRRLPEGDLHRLRMTSKSSKPKSARRLDDSFDNAIEMMTLAKETIEGAVTNDDHALGDITTRSNSSADSIFSTSSHSIEHNRIVEKRRTIVTSDFSPRTLLLLKLTCAIDYWLTEALILLKQTMSTFVYIFFFSFITFGAILINRLQPVPFIDELFHVRQARQYCQGNYSHWDDKITTPPGLYLTSIGLFQPLNNLLNSTDCSLFQLRATNIFITLATSIFMLFYYDRINAKASKTLNNLNGISSLPYLDSISTALFPPLFFFTFLYYTDPGSFLFLLVTFYFALAEKRYWISSVFAAISLLYRQTNIIWIFFCAIAGVLNIAQQENVQHRGGYFALLQRISIKVILSEGGFLLNGIGFLAFLIWNNGIVLGDQSAHQPGFHLAQFPYFLLFTAFFGAVHIFTVDNVAYVWRLLCERMYLITSLVMIISACLQPQFTYVHPYLLADNRHYTFYLWKRILSNVSAPWLRYTIVPLCTFTLCSVWRTVNFTHEMRRGANIQNQFLKFVFIVLTLVTLVPQQLLEFRYFIVPFLVWRLNLESRTKLQLYLEAIYFLLINMVTIYIFAVKIFYHPGSSEKQRIIW